MMYDVIVRCVLNVLNNAVALLTFKQNQNSSIHIAILCRRATHPKRDFWGTPNKIFGSTRPQIFNMINSEIKIHIYQLQSIPFYKYTIYYVDDANKRRKSGCKTGTSSSVVAEKVSNNLDLLLLLLLLLQSLLQHQLDK
jgi:hypothetical protein